MGDWGKRCGALFGNFPVQSGQQVRIGCALVFVYGCMWMIIKATNGSWLAGGLAYFFVVPTEPLKLHMGGPEEIIRYVV